MNPNHETAYRMRGDLLRQMGDNRKAIDDYTQAIKKILTFLLLTSVEEKRMKLWANTLKQLKTTPKRLNFILKMALVTAIGVLSTAS